MQRKIDSLATRELSRRTALQGIGAASLAVLATRAGLAGVAAQEATPPAGDYPTVEFTAEKMRYVGLPASLPGGLTRLTLRNVDPVDHHAMFVRINDDKSADDFGAALKSGDLGQLLSVTTSLGGPGSIGPGEVSTTIVDLTPGQYMVLCLVPDEETGMPHAAMGMISPLEVTAAAAALEAPNADAKIDLADFAFMGLPSELSAGPHTWEVTDTGKQLHEVVVFRQAEGVPYSVIEGIFLAPPPASPEAEVEGEASPAASGPPPFTAVTGVAPMTPGETNYLEVDFQAGDYFAICFIPDPATGAPHFALGMIMPFTVT